MKCNFKKIILSILLFTIISGCTYFPFSLFTNYPVQPKIYKDSLLINYFLFRESQRHSDYDKIDIKIGSIYYSPDSLKGFGFYTYKFYKDKSLNDISLMGDGFAMIRDSINQPWEIFNTLPLSVFGYTDDQDVFNVLERYYRNPYSVKGDILNPRLNYFKIVNQLGIEINHQRQILYKDFYSKWDRIYLYDCFSDIYKQNNIYKDYIFNNSELGTEEFWSNSYYFKKGPIVPWLYNFQLKRILIVQEHEHRNYYQYPDSILEIYKGKK